MIQSREVIPPSLEHALRASRIVAALEQMEGKSSSCVPIDVLDDALAFFQLILDARNKVKGRELPTGPLEGGLAYGEAIQAIGRIPQFKNGSGEMTKVVKLLGNTVKELRDRKDCSGESVRLLIDFFRLVRDISLASDKRGIERLVLAE